MAAKERIVKFLTMDRAMRFSLFVVILAILSWGKNNLSDQANNDTTGAIKDLLFDWTQSVNEMLLSGTAWATFFEVSSSWCIDLIFLGMFVPWIYNGDSSRLILAFALFYGIRSLVQTMCVLPYPQGMIWIYPVIPSITVPFGVTSDFMPSGHVGFCIIGAAEFFKRRWYIPMVMAWIIGLYEAFVMLSTRGHYSIDLFFGAVMGHYMHGWAHVLSNGDFWGKICIDKAVGPYLLYHWESNKLNVTKSSKFNATEDVADGGLTSDIEVATVTPPNTF